MSSSTLSDALTKLADNAAHVRRRSFVEDRFFGLFCYEECGVEADRFARTLSTLKVAVDGSCKRLINCLCFGPSAFVRYWHCSPQDHRVPVDQWHAYHVEGVAPAYFLHNVVEHLCSRSVYDNEDLWFPAQGKEPYKVAEMPIKEAEHAPGDWEKGKTDGTCVH